MEPKNMLNDPEQIKSLITVLQQLLVQTQGTSSIEDNKKSDKPKAKKKTKKAEHSNNEDFSNVTIKTRKKGPVKSVSSINKFDTMNEFYMHQDDKLIDNKLVKHPPVARNREFTPVSVKCRVCGKTENISPSLIYEGPARYKCNSCSTSAG